MIFLTPPEPKTIILCIGLQSVYFCFVFAKKKEKPKKKKQKQKKTSFIKI